MRRRRVLRVQLDRCSSLVSGPGAHELIRAETGHLPVYIHRLRGFSVSEETARSVIAQAEHLGYDVEVLGRRTRREAAITALRAAPAPRFLEQPDPGRGLW